MPPTPCNLEITDPHPPSQKRNDISHLETVPGCVRPCKVTRLTKVTPSPSLFLAGTFRLTHKKETAMFNRIKAAFMNASAVQAPAPVVEAPAKTKAPRKPRKPKGLSDIQKATQERMAGYSLSGMDKAAAEAFGKSFEASIHEYLRKGNEAEQSGRGIGDKLNVMLAKPGDNVHWSETLDEKRKDMNEAVRLRYIAKYIEVKKAQGKGASRATARGSWRLIVGYSMEAANFKAASNGKGSGNAKDYATFALENATAAYKRGYRIPADKRDATDTTAMESYGSIITAYKGEAGLKAVQKAVNDALKPKGNGKASAAKGKGPTRKPRTGAKASYPRKTKV